MGRINVFPVPNTLHRRAVAPALQAAAGPHRAEPQYELVIVDSLTAFVTHASESETLDFFSQAKDLCDAGRSLMLTMHSYASNEQLLTRLRSICDAHMRLRVEEVGSSSSRCSRSPRCEARPRTPAISFPSTLSRTSACASSRSRRPSMSETATKAVKPPKQKRAKAPEPESPEIRAGSAASRLPGGARLAPHLAPTCESWT